MSAVSLKQTSKRAVKRRERAVRGGRADPAMTTGAARAAGAAQRGRTLLANEDGSEANRATRRPGGGGSGPGARASAVGKAASVGQQGHPRDAVLKPVKPRKYMFVLTTKMEQGNEIKKRI